MIKGYLEDERTFDLVCAAIMEFREEQTGELFFDGKCAELATAVIGRLLAEVTAVPPPTPAEIWKQVEEER